MRYKSQPQVLRHELEGDLFAFQFLGSHDFDSQTLREICMAFNVPVTTKIMDMLNNLNPLISESQFDDDFARLILQHMVRRQRKWCTFRIGRVSEFRETNSPLDLVWREGKSQWYGPLPDLDDESVFWYIHPYFLPSYEIDENDPSIIHRFQVRGLCLARTTQGSISLHWHGYSLSEDNPERVSQISYWEFVPKYFDELEQLLGCELTQPQLEDLVLHRLWNEYCLNSDYIWDHTRIRAEAGGVALSAHSSLVSRDPEERDMKGIQHLAHALQQAILLSARENEVELVETMHLEEVILGTLIRNFGAKSYGFALKTKDGSNIIRAHVYFGSKPNHHNQDSFPHINFFTGWSPVIDQFNFLLDHS